MKRLSAGLAIAVLSFTIGLCSRLEGQAPKQPVLLDTDFGNDMDDALALALLLASPNIDLKAVTTSGGDCEDRAWMVCRLLTMVDRKDIPVAWGRDPQPDGEVKEMFQYRYHPAVLFNRTGKPVAQDAADLLYEKLKESPKGETTLVAIGSLTNVARLLDKHPDGKEFLKRIVVMGGNFQNGKRPDWKYGRDIRAAQAVFSSGVPLVVVMLDTDVKLAEEQRESLFAAQTMLTQQLQTLYELSKEALPSISDTVAVAVSFDSGLFKSGRRSSQRITINDDGIIEVSNREPNADVLTNVDAVSLSNTLEVIGKYGSKTRPRPLGNFSKLVERGSLPARVHAFEDYETDIERRWWLAGRALTNDVANGKRSMRSVLTLDFDDLQGDLKSMYSAVVFNPVPGPPMGPRTRLSFRYKLDGTSELRVQLYSLSNGYHRYLALKDLASGEWRSATVDMTDMRRPDGTGGALAEDERIDDIQFYVEPKAHVAVDDVVLYEAAPDGETKPFPKRIVFTGWFDTGKQGKEWPGDYEIVEHEKPRKWKTAKSVLNKDLNQPWLRVSFRGERPIGRLATVARFRYRLTGADWFEVQLVNSKRPGQRLAETVVKSPVNEWKEASLVFSQADARTPGEAIEMQAADELRFLLPAGGELLVDDVLVYEPNEK